MNRIQLAIRFTLFFPTMWIILTVIALVLMANGWEPGADISSYTPIHLFN
ncbi:MAG: hypothetical protein GY832_04690 [Chloroflexi bacterium]|nr:hypothetical protein [Chloroflexota bacterium]